MADLFKIKQGNQRPYLKVTLNRLNDEGGIEGPADLTNADTITFTMKNKETNTIKIEKGIDVEILGLPEAGNVQYKWQVGDTDDFGKFLGEFDVIYLDGEEETFPNGDKGFDIKITERLS